MRDTRVENWVKHLVEWWGQKKKIIIPNIFLQDMTSSQNSDPISPKTTTLMVALDKLTVQMNQMQQHNQQ